MTREQAQLIWRASDLGATLANEEEVGLLQENNPELLAAYFALHRLGFGVVGTVEANNIASEGTS